MGCELALSERLIKVRFRPFPAVDGRRGDRKESAQTRNSIDVADAIGQENLESVRVFGYPAQVLNQSHCFKRVWCDMTNVANLTSECVGQFQSAFPDVETVLSEA